jgi:hypothetical protein
MVMGVSTTSAAAATRHVDQAGSDSGECVTNPCETIQYAVGQALAGDTIEVGAGIYAEQLTIAKALTLRGPNAGIDPNVGSRVAEAVINGGTGTAIAPQAAGIAIDGFTVSTADSGLPIYTGTGDIDDLTIANDIVGSGIRAITIETGGDDIAIEHNLIEGDVYGVIFAAGNYGGLEIDANVIDGSAGSTALFNAGASTFDELELVGNTIFNTSNLGGAISEGVVIGNSFDVDHPGAMNLQIDLHQSILAGNTFDGNGTTACLQLFGSQFGLDPSSSVAVVANSFDRCAPYGIQLSPDIEDIVIAGNTISDSFDGINTRDITPWSLSGNDIEIVANRITGSSHLGVSNSVEGTLDARDNWWGCNAGPTSDGSKGCDGISAGVNAGPWVVVTASAASASILPGGSTTVTARLDTNSAGAPVADLPDGAPVSFASSLGSLAPTTAPLTAGAASATFTADGRSGNAGVTAALDAQLVAVPLAVAAPPAPAPPAPTPAPAPIETPPLVKRSGGDGPKNVPASGTVTVATVSCPSGTCKVAVRSPRLRIGGGTYKIRVRAPKRIAAGRSASARVVLSKAARAALAEKGKGRLTLRLTVTSSDGQKETLAIKVVLKDARHDRRGD